jgi:hypothetical protein
VYIWIINIRLEIFNIRSLNFLRYVFRKS